MAPTDTAAPMTEVGYVNPDPWWTAVQREPTPELVWPNSVQIYDSMRRQDAQCMSVLRAVTLPILRTRWSVDPYGARSEVTQLIAEDLRLPVVGENPKPLPRTQDRFSWIEHLRLALLMLPYGFSFFEQVYRIDDAGRVRLRKLAPRPAWTISEIKVARDGGLTSIVQEAAPASIMNPRRGRGQFEPVEIPVDRLVAYVHEREGGDWTGHSLLRPAYKHWLLKDRLLRVQTQSIERNGMGVPLYKGGDAGEDLTAGLAMAKRWRAGDNSGAAVPKDADLVLRGVEGTLPDAQGAIRYHDEQIARAVLAHFLNLGTQTGSWALGTTFADFFVMSLQSTAQVAADTASQHIVEDLVDANYGPDEPAPRLVFEEIGSQQAATAQSLKLLFDAGIIRPDGPLEEAVRQQYGLPPSDPSTATTPAATPQESVA